MAVPRDNMDEEMMDIINTGTQFADGDQQDVDDGVNTWLLKITKKILCKKILARYIYLYIYLNIVYIYLNIVYIYLNIYHLLCVHMIFIYSFFYT